MTLRTQARSLAEDAYREALAGMFGLIERRIEWRWAHAPLLALEAERMVWLLERAPGHTPFRRARIKTWTRRHRRHSARAWATSRATAAACRLPK